MPESAAFDGGFASAENAKYALAQGVKNVCFTKGVGKELAKLMPSPATQRLLYRFRAGVEGVLSTLIRAVGLGRCLWKGWEAFQSYVWASIIAHNLKMLTETLLGRPRRRLARA